MKMYKVTNLDQVEFIALCEDSVVVLLLVALLALGFPLFLVLLQHKDEEFVPLIVNRISYLGRLVIDIIEEGN